MSFAIPNKGVPTSDIQSVLYATDVDIMSNGAEGGTFVQSGCAVAQQGTPDMTVAVASGVVYSGGTRFVYAGGNGTVTTADATNPRLDYVVLDSSGTLAVRAGTAAAAPLAPTLTAGDVALAQVYVAAAVTSIVTASIYDRRIINPQLVGDLIALPSIPNPSAPSAGILFYGKDVGGRQVPKYIGPSGVDSPLQTAIWGNNLIFYSPGDSTTVGISPGGLFTSGGTVSHPTPTAGIASQMKRTRWANVATTTNQTLGLYQKTASENAFWRGNAAGLGGFFFFARFGIGLWPAATVRLFVGLTGNTGAMTVSDTPTGDYIGLWHDTTDAASVLSLIHRDNSTTVKTAISGTPTLAAGQWFDFYMFCAENGSTIYYRLDDLNAQSTILDTTGIATNIPRNTVFMGPQAAMSNGTANITVTTTAFELNRLYVESDH